MPRWQWQWQGTHKGGTRSRWRCCASKRPSATVSSCQINNWSNGPRPTCGFLSTTKLTNWDFCWPLGRQSLICYHGERSRRVNLCTVATSATLSRPHPFHCEQHSLLRVNLGPRLHQPDHQHRLCLASGPQEDLSSQVTGHRPEFQVLCRTSCACVHRFSASPFSSNPRTTQ